MASNFFPTNDYKMPESSSYMKLTEGVHTFRIMSAAVIGYEYFREDNKPVRSKDNFEDMPHDIKRGGTIKHFWSFVIWNRDARKIQIMELTQKTLMTPLKALFDNPKWGSPVNSYDITITRKGTTKNDTEYSVMPNPAEPNDEEMSDAFNKTPIDLEKLFTGEDPFKLF